MTERRVKLSHPPRALRNLKQPLLPSAPVVTTLTRDGRSSSQQNVAQKIGPEDKQPLLHQVNASPSRQGGFVRMQQWSPGLTLRSVTVADTATPTGIGLSPELSLTPAISSPITITARAEHKLSVQNAVVEPTKSEVKQTPIEQQHSQPQPQLAPALSPSEIAERWARLMKDEKPMELSMSNSELCVLIWEGLPTALRPTIWGKLLDDGRNKEEKERYFEKLLQQAHELKSAVEDEIAKDIHRTFPGHPFFKSASGKESLRKVLTALSMHNTVVGYCQGLNFIAAALLLVAQDEAVAFAMLSKLVDQRVSCYCESMIGAQLETRVLTELLAYAEPKIVAHLQKLGLQLGHFLSSWMLCLFNQCPLSFEDTLRFWDALFLFGDSLLIDMALTVMKLSRETIIATESPEQVMDLLLRGLGKLHPIDVLMRTLKTIHSEVSRSQIASLKDLYRYEVITDATTLQKTVMRRLEKTSHFNPEELQKLWECFIEPAPWPILVNGGIQSLVHFTRAFSRCVFSDAHVKSWRGRGIVNGVMQRLFELILRLNTTKLGSVSENATPTSTTPTANSPNKGSSNSTSSGNGQSSTLIISTSGPSTPASPSSGQQMNANGQLPYANSSTSIPGVLDFDAFVAGCSIFIKSNRAGRLKFAFAFVDRHDHGRITAEDMHAALTMFDVMYNGVRHSEEVDAFCKTAFIKTLHADTAGDASALSISPHGNLTSRSSSTGSLRKLEQQQPSSPASVGQDNASQAPIVLQIAPTMAYDDFRRIAILSPLFVRFFALHDIVPDG